MYLLIFIFGIIFGGLGGIFLESKNAQNDINKTKKELISKENIIVSLTREILHLRERR
ncbi:MAG: hypothetical protein ABF289_20135 [Clostridiales bacterium]